MEHAHGNVGGMNLSEFINNQMHIESDLQREFHVGKCIPCLNALSDGGAIVVVSSF